MFPRTVLTDSQLRDYTDCHLVYEATNLFICGRVVATLGKPASLGEYGIQTAIIGSFALHLRNVVDFFYDDAPEVNDLVAAHFFALWPVKRRKPSKALVAANTRARAQLLGLTTARIARTPALKEWDPLPLLRELKGTFDTFLSGASDLRLGAKARLTLRALADREIELDGPVRD